MGDGNPTGLGLDVEDLCWSRTGGALETTLSGKTDGKTTGTGWEIDLFCSWLGYFGLEQVWSILQCLVCLSHLVLHLLMNYTPRVGRGGSGKELLASRNEPLVLKGLLKFLKRQLLSVHSVSHENRAGSNQQSWLRVGMSSGAGAVSTHHLWDL